MNIWITGGTGFVGTRLSALLLEKGHGVAAVGSRPDFEGIRHPNFRYVSADTSREGPWQEGLREADAVVNLTGRSIFSYWTERTKAQIYESRVATTRNIAAALGGDPGRERVLVSTSAVGYYGDRGDEILTEASPRGEGFLADLSRDWEAAALAAGDTAVRVVIARFGIVLDKSGGALKQMLPPFRLGLGGPMGDGRHWFPWIHMDDLLSAILFALTDAKVAGPVNLTAPNPVQNRTFVKALGRVLLRPALVPVPGCVIRTALGELGGVLLSSQRVLPVRLLDSGFRFEYPDIAPALKHLIRG
ncbi:TIGR01777 family oxidoreductase [Desulfococcus sp.]|uniref:TIGR01777 family oxidoreductase n=1 Tax=Desulfococcus sp. TaxID=2025834 RepID=UPI0035934EB9